MDGSLSCWSGMKYDRCHELGIEWNNKRKSSTNAVQSIWFTSFHPIHPVSWHCAIAYLLIYFLYNNRTHVDTCVSLYIFFSFLIDIVSVVFGAEVYCKVGVDVWTHNPHPSHQCRCPNSWQNIKKKKNILKISNLVQPQFAKK